MGKGFLVNVISLAFNGEWWRQDNENRKLRISKLGESIRELQKKEGVKVLRTYSSLRWDSDLIFWIMSEISEHLLTLKRKIMESLGEFSTFTHGFLSLYEPSPYFRGGIREPVHEPKKYFIAYPMKKDPEWYLIDEGERRKIVEEHIRIAVSHPENKDIISYTTYSFGIDDWEFLVIYELDSLSNWVHVTEKLREAKARKWIVREDPILVGELLNL
jgi:chlorite dismutase